MTNRPEPRSSRQSAPDDGEPSPARQDAPRAAYEAGAVPLRGRDVDKPAYSYHGVGVRGRGELRWILRERGWSAEPDTPSARRVNLAGANLRGVHLGGMHLCMAVLADAGLLEVTLRGALLIGADFMDANLR